MRYGETIDVVEGVTIIQPARGYRVTTDSILLARLSHPPRRSRVLELCAGCGIVSILLAKRDPTLKITAVEIQRELVDMANRSKVLNNVKDHIEFLHMDIKDLPGIFEGATFDYIIINPPYRSPHSGRISPHPGRATGAHEVALSLDDILKVSRHLLKVGGRLSMIYITERLVDLLCTMRTYRIEPKEIRFIKTGKGRYRFFWVEGIREGGPGLKIEIWAQK